MWAMGSHPDQVNDEDRECSYEEQEGPPPVESDYMPFWEESKKTHYQMYEDTTEGTPISPVMDSAEKLALWLVENGASAFAGRTADYGWWMGAIEDEGSMVTMEGITFL